MSVTLSNLAAGAVVTGFAYPLVAKYAVAGGTVAYSDGMALARGVSIKPNIETYDKDFFADDIVAESAQARFKSGDVALTVDGLLIAAERFILGVPTADVESLTVGSATVAVTGYGTGQRIPYVGLGAVVTVQSNGVEYYFGVMYTKVRFKQFAVAAQTLGEEVDWQTTDLSAKLHRDDSAKHYWQRVTELLETKLEAYNAVRVLLGMSTVAALPET